MDQHIHYGEWHKWFAWYPVWMGGNKKPWYKNFAWRRYICRKVTTYVIGIDEWYQLTDYRELDTALPIPQHNEEVNMKQDQFTSVPLTAHNRRYGWRAGYPIDPITEK